MTRLEKITSLYSALTGDASVTPAEINTYAGLAETVTLEAISASLTADSVLNFGAMPANDLLDYMFINLFDYTQVEVDALRATEAGAAGFAYWVDELANNSTMINANTIAIALLNGAGVLDDARATAKVAADVAAYEAAYEGSTPVTDGSEFFLTAGVDVLEGTDGEDEFIADLNQTPFAGTVSNTLATGDRLDGGASTDTLTAQLTIQNVGVWSDTTNVQPRTTDVEVVQIEAQDFDSAGGYAVLDAKNMKGIDEIGSYYSDGDLVIENLTTLTDAGVARNTSALTITMDHTDNFNSDEDASDLTVYLDEDYLLSGETLGTSVANYWLLDEESEDYVTEPLLNIERDGVTFTIDGVAYELRMDSATAEAADTWDAFAAGLQAVLNTTAEPAFVGLSIAVDTANTDSTYNDFGALVTIPAITITDAQGRDIVPTGFTTPEGVIGGFDIYGQFDNVPAVTSADALSINVELNKVGREGEGGNLIIGGKELDSDGDREDQGNGIAEFNISVVGDASKPSNLGVIASTNGALRTVNVSTADTSLDSFASLTVRGSGTTSLNDNVADNTAPFGGTLATFNANAFLGDLDIGEDTRASDINTFTATGGGDVTLYANNTTAGNTVTTGAGDDYLNIIDAGTLDVNSGAGDDELVLDLALTNNDIMAGSGNDTITMTGATVAVVDIDAGSGNDVVYGNADSVNVTDGLGNDVVYVQNDGTKAVQTIATSTENDLNTLGSINPGAHDPLDYQLMYGRSVQVTIAAPNAAASAANSFVEGFESLVVNVVTDSYVSTLAEFNAAIVDAINDDAVLGNLAEASVVGGDVVVSWMVDGVVSTVGSVEVEVSGTWADLSLTEQTAMVNEFIALYPDSTITAAQVELAYNAITTDYTASTVDTAGDASGAVTANSVTLSGGDDFIALSAAATDTVIFEAGVQIGTDAIVNFDATDAFDFTDFLADLEDLSIANGNTLSATRIATTLGVENSAAIDLTSNEIAIVNDFAEAGVETWASMTDDAIDAALSGTEDYANIAVGATSADAQLVGTTQRSILMVENDQNAGEYKVFEVTEATTTSDYTVNLLGIVDFGGEITTAAVI